MVLTLTKRQIAFGARFLAAAAPENVLPEHLSAGRIRSNPIPASLHAPVSYRYGQQTDCAFQLALSRPGTL